MPATSLLGPFNLITLPNFINLKCLQQVCSDPVNWLHYLKRNILNACSKSAEDVAPGYTTSVRIRFWEIQGNKLLDVVIQPEQTCEPTNELWIYVILIVRRTKMTMLVLDVYFRHYLHLIRRRLSQ